MVYCWLNLWMWNYGYTTTKELRTHRAWGSKKDHSKKWKHGSDEHTDGIPSLGNERRISELDEDREKSQGLSLGYSNMERSGKQGSKL